MKLLRLCFDRWVSVHRGAALGGCMVLGGRMVPVGLVLEDAWSEGVSQHALRQTLPPSDSYCCGQYASYWNAFLFYIFKDRFFFNFSLQIF